jgi:ketosteroid isomerase-like protein
MNQAHDHSDSETVAAQLRAAFESRDLAALGAVLDDDVRWGGEEDTAETCHSRAQVLERLAQQRANGVQTGVIEVVPGHHAVLLGLTVKRPVGGDFSREHNVYQVLSLRKGRVVDIRGYPERATAVARAGIRATGPDAMQARHLVPILNVSNLPASFRLVHQTGLGQTVGLAQRRWHAGLRSGEVRRLRALFESQRAGRSRHVALDLGGGC